MFSQNYQYTNQKDTTQANELLNAKITILGQRIENIPCHDKQRFIQQMSQWTLWFSYRKNFKALLNSKETEDSGWGCMLRSGQMIWAQMLRVHLRDKANVRNYQHQLLLAFVDDDEEDSNCSPFSIQKIATIAKLQLDIDPGKWYSPDKILIVLQKLHELNQVNGTQDLKLVITDNIFHDRLYCEMYGLTTNCEHILQRLKIQPEIEFTKICDQCPHSQPKALAIFVNCMIGMDHVEPKYLNFLNDLIDLPYFQGFIGGQPARAHYFIGRIDNKYVYLDPHYTQEAVNARNLLSFKNTYFQKEVRTILNTQISPSMSIGFYVKNELQLKDFFQRIQQLQQQNIDNSFIYANELTPNSYVDPTLNKGQIIELDDEFGEI